MIKENNCLIYTLLILLVFIINMSTMPEIFYAGDAYTIKLEAINLVKNKSLGIDYTKRDKLKELLQSKGQFFFENDQKKKFFSRWGTANTVIFAIPELFQNNSDTYINDASILRHNYLNVTLSAIFAIYLFSVAGLYIQSKSVRFLFVILTLYSTFVWNYLRAQSYEIIQVAFFCGFIFHLIKFLRREITLNKHYFLWNFFLLILVLSKSIYFILYPCVIFALYNKLSSVPCDKKKYYMIRTLISVMIPFTFTLFLHSLDCFVRFGEFRLGGGGKAIPGNLEVPWAINYFYDRAYDYIFSLNFSIFVHFPILIFSIFGVKRFYNNYQKECIFLATVFVITSLIYGMFYSVGEWCYGPRYFLFILPILSLPALYFIEEKFTKLNIKKICFAVIFVIIIVYSTYLQFAINSLPFFSNYDLEHFFNKFGNSRINNYFRVMNHAIIDKGFISFMKGNDNFFPVKEFLNYVPEQKREIAKVRLRKRFQKTIIRDN